MYVDVYSAENESHNAPKTVQRAHDVLKPPSNVNILREG